MDYELIDELGDDELLARLIQRGCEPAWAGALVVSRDKDEVLEEISRWFDRKD